MSHGLVSGVLSEQVKPSAEFCIKAAEALGFDPVAILKLAGYLSTESAEGTVIQDVAIQELINLAEAMPPQDRQKLIDFARFLRQQRD